MRTKTKIVIPVTEYDLSRGIRNCCFRGPLSLAMRREGLKWNGPASTGAPIEHADEVFFEWQGKPKRANLSFKTQQVLRRWHEGEQVQPFDVTLYYSRFYDIDPTQTDL